MGAAAHAHRATAQPQDRKVVNLPGVVSAVIEIQHSRGSYRIPAPAVTCFQPIEGSDACAGLDEISRPEYFAGDHDVVAAFHGESGKGSDCDGDVSGREDVAEGTTVIGIAQLEHVDSGAVDRKLPTVGVGGVPVNKHGGRRAAACQDEHSLVYDQFAGVCVIGRQDGAAGAAFGKTNRATRIIGKGGANPEITEVCRSGLDQQ